MLTICMSLKDTAYTSGKNGMCIRTYCPTVNLIHMYEVIYKHLTVICDINYTRRSAFGKAIMMELQ